MDSLREIDVELGPLYVSGQDVRALGVLRDDRVIAVTVEHREPKQAKVTVGWRGQA